MNTTPSFEASRHFLTNKKLSNENFLKKAPPEVVEKEKRIKEELEEDLSKVDRILGVLRS